MVKLVHVPTALVSDQATSATFISICSPAATTMFTRVSRPEQMDFAGPQVGHTRLRHAEPGRGLRLGPARLAVRTKRG